MRASRRKIVSLADGLVVPGKILRSEVMGSPVFEVAVLAGVSVVAGVVVIDWDWSVVLVGVVVVC